MKRPVWTCLALCVFTGCSEPDVPKPVSTPATPRNAKIPVEVSYPIIRDIEYYNISEKKRLVGVRLNMKVSGEVLGEMALEVKSTEKHQYERTYIDFYLPGGHKPWAVANFDPVLKVEIWGLSIEEERKLRSTPLAHPGSRIGAWLIDGESSGGLRLLYEDGGEIRMIELSPSGFFHTIDMLELPPGKGRRFKKAQGTDIYEIDGAGDLLVIASDGGVVLTGHPLPAP